MKKLILWIMRAPFECLFWIAAYGESLCEAVANWADKISLGIMDRYTHE